MSWHWWMTLLAILAGLVALGCIPLGIHAEYRNEAVSLSVKIGFLRLQLLPAKPRKAGKLQKQKVPSRAKRPPCQKAAAPQGQRDHLTQPNAAPPSHDSQGCSPTADEPFCFAAPEVRQIEFDTGSAKKKFSHPEKSIPLRRAVTVQPATAPASASSGKKGLSLPTDPAELLRLVRFALDVLGDLRYKLRVNELTLHVRFGADDPSDAALHYGRAWALIGALTPALDRLFVIKKRDIRPVLDYNSTKMAVEARLLLSITIGRILALALRAGLGFLKLTKKGGATL